jgi:hypothetical protein
LRLNLAPFLHEQHRQTHGNHHENHEHDHRNQHALVLVAGGHERKSFGSKGSNYRLRTEWLGGAPSMNRDPSTQTKSTGTNIRGVNRRNEVVKGISSVATDVPRPGGASVEST